MHSLAVDLHLQRSEAGPAENEDDAEAGEAEEVDQERSRNDGWPQQRQRDLPEDLPTACAQYSRCVRLAGIEIGPEASHDAHDDGHIVEDMRQQDEPDGMLDVNGRGT